MKPGDVHVPKSIMYAFRVKKINCIKYQLPPPIFDRQPHKKQSTTKNIYSFYPDRDTDSCLTQVAVKYLYDIEYVRQKRSKKHNIAMSGLNVGNLYDHGEEDQLDDFNIELDNKPNLQSGFLGPLDIAACNRYARQS